MNGSRNHFNNLPCSLLPLREKQNKTEQKTVSGYWLVGSIRTFCYKNFFFIRGEAHKNPNLIPQETCTLLYVHGLLKKFKQATSFSWELSQVCPYPWNTRAGSKHCNDLSSLISYIWQNWLHKSGTFVFLQTLVPDLTTLSGWKPYADSFLER